MNISLTYIFFLNLKTVPQSHIFIKNVIPDKKFKCFGAVEALNWNNVIPYTVWCYF